MLRHLDQSGQNNKMATIGSLVFCTVCGNLLPASKGSVKNILHCECCGAENQGVYYCVVLVDMAA